MPTGFQTLLSLVTSPKPTVRTTFVLATARAIVINVNPTGKYQIERQAWRALCAAFYWHLLESDNLAPRAIGTLQQDIASVVTWIQEGLL